MSSADSTPPWLTLVGIGEDGYPGLGKQARRALLQASRIVGAARQLELLPPCIGAARETWPTPFSLEPLLARRGQPTCVLASGDPMLFGVGASLARQLPATELRVLPAPSSLSLAAARLGWALQEVACLSLVARPLAALQAQVHDGRCLLVLSNDGDSPAAIARLLNARGFGASRLSVLEPLGGPLERRLDGLAGDWSLPRAADLNLVAVECRAGTDAVRLPLTPGLADEAYRHDGQLTKRDVRAVTLARLAPCPGELLWDVGAGCGSIGIEWMRAHPSCRAIAIEANDERQEHIRHNRDALGVPTLHLVAGSAPEALLELPEPDAIFIGGGVTAEGVLETCWERLRPGGRLLAGARPCRSPCWNCANPPPGSLPAMREETPEQPAPLRSGYTTGSCATATSLAAARLLLGGTISDAVQIVLPKGQQVLMRLEFCRAWENGAEAGTLKDAGDDPDVTHGALVFARVRLGAEPGVRFHAGPGVGTVTRPGLTLAVGEPAINPVPRQMIERHLAQLAAERGYAGGFEVAIGVEGGAELALKTMNPRLGILGGLSILGTSGIVRPFSCSAYIASIHQGIDVARANGVRHIAACTGNASEDAMRRRYGLPEIALIEMGDFAGAVLKHLRKAPVEKLSLCGGFGKISKLAGGHLDLHSRHSSIDLPQLAGWAAALGASAALQDCMRAANTSQQALAQAHAEGVALGDAVCAHALRFARSIVPTEVALEVFAIDRQGNLVGQACEERR